MQQRPIGFVFGLALIFAGLMLFQQWMFPPRPNLDKPVVAAPVAETREAESTALAGTGEQESVAAPELGKTGDSASAENADAQLPEAGNKAPSLDAGEPAITLAPIDISKTTAADPAKFYTLGSLSSDGKDRYLVTLTSAGACVYRVELNARDRNGQYRYRDLDHFGGFVGKMELSRGDGGLEVNLVGPGSPADAAGIRIGDLIQTINDVPVVSATDFQAIITKTKVGQELKLGVVRKIGDQVPEQLSLRLTLTDQPLELIQPEKGQKYPELTSPSSFGTLLRNPKSNAMEWPVIDNLMATAAWDCSDIEIDGQRGLEFRWTVPDDKLQPLGLKGPITVLKRYWLKTPDEAERYNFASRSFHINFQMEIRTESTEPVAVALQLSGPNGLPSEGWWYQNKIHGESTAIGSMAGARDVVSSTSLVPYKFFGTPEIVSEAKKKDSGKFLTLVDSPDVQTGKNSTVNFLGVDSQYFHVALLPHFNPETPTAGFECFSAFAAVVSHEIPKNSKLYRLVDCSFLMFDRATISADSPYQKTWEIFAGPKEADLLATYRLESNRTFGWFGWLSQFLCGLLGFFYWITGSFSYGLAIILLTVLVRTLMIPISRKAALNAQMMQHLAPEMKAIADKYKDEMDKRSQAQRELFARHKYNPFGGCFLMFLQLPVFIGLYRGLSVDIALRDQPLIPGMQWCSNLAAPDQCYYWENWAWMPTWLGSETGWLGPWLNILPIITIVLFLIQQKLFTPPATDDQQKFAQKMMTYMMIFMGVMFFRVPSGLCIYFITSSIWGIVERKMLPKPQLSAEKIASIKGEPAEAEPAAPAKEKKARSGFGKDMMKRLRDQIEYGEQRPVQQQVDAETKKRMDRERKKKRRDNER